MLEEIKVSNKTKLGLMSKDSKRYVIDYKDYYKDNRLKMISKLKGHFVDEGVSSFIDLVFPEIPAKEMNLLEFTKRLVFNEYEKAKRKILTQDGATV